MYGIHPTNPFNENVTGQPVKNLQDRLGDKWHHFFDERLGFGAKPRRVCVWRAQWAGPRTSRAGAWSHLVTTASCRCSTEGASSTSLLGRRPQRQQRSQQRKRRPRPPTRPPTRPQPRPRPRRRLPRRVREYMFRCLMHVSKYNSNSRNSATVIDSAAALDMPGGALAMGRVVGKMAGKKRSHFFGETITGPPRAAFSHSFLPAAVNETPPPRLLPIRP